MRPQDASVTDRKGSEVGIEYVREGVRVHVDYRDYSLLKSFKIFYTTQEWGSKT